MELLFIFTAVLFLIGLLMKIDDDGPWGVFWAFSLASVVVVVMWYMVTEVQVEEVPVETGYVVNTNKKVQFFTDREGEQVLLEPIYDESDSLVVEIKYPRPGSLDGMTYNVRRP